MKVRVMTVQIKVTVPRLISENRVETAINAALDEPPCDWGEWTVGGAVITAVEHKDAKQSLS